MILEISALSQIAYVHFFSTFLEFINQTLLFFSHFSKRAELFREKKCRVISGMKTGTLVNLSHYIIK